MLFSNFSISSLNFAAFSKSRFSADFIISFLNSIKLFYETSGALKYVKNKVKVYFDKADQLINKLELDNDTKRKLNQFSKTLLNREI